MLALEADLEVIGQVGDGDAAIRASAEHSPDVVVMDLGLPGLDGVAATARILAAKPETKILGLTAYEDRESMQQLLRAGAAGYVLKRSAAADLVQAIRAVARGATYIDPAMAEHLVAGLRDRRARAEEPAELSDREAEVLRHLSRGLQMKEIAQALDLSARTVETYKARAMEKLQISSRVELTQYALQRGWLR